MYKLNSWKSFALFWRACHLHWQQLQAMRGWGGSEEAVFWYVLVARFILEMDHPFGMSLGKEMVAHLIIGLSINTGKQTDHASTRAIAIVRLVRRTIVDNSLIWMIRLLGPIYTQTDYQTSTSYRLLPKLIPNRWSVSSINRASVNNTCLCWGQ